MTFNFKELLGCKMSKENKEDVYESMWQMSYFEGVEGGCIVTCIQAELLLTLCRAELK